MSRADTTRPESPTYAVVKRLFDIVAAVVLLFFTAPLLLVCAVAVRLESPGPVIFRQRRVGRFGRLFSIYKIRTMVDGAEGIGAGLAIEAGDARITRVGDLLRRYSLDELPNLFNVLHGEMSLIGPRPTVASQVERYSERQRGRLRVKPGITGWAQVNGRASLPWVERIELDLWYVDNLSLKLDLKILLKTAVMVFRGGDIYKGVEGGWREEDFAEQGSDKDSAKRDEI